MAKVPSSIRKLLQKYISSLRKEGIDIVEAFLFGSYASGRYNEFSDIDIAVISNSFEGQRFFDRNKIKKVTLSISSKIEVIPFNPKDFNEENPFAKEIIETGIRIS